MYRLVVNARSLWGENSMIHEHLKQRLETLRGTLRKACLIDGLARLALALGLLFKTSALRHHSCRMRW